jgi:Ninjurin
VQDPQIEGTLNFNNYASRKSLALGLLDLSLLAANVTQLKKLLTSDSDKTDFIHVMLVLVIISIVLQVSLIE